jgi:hypothetical protein
MRRFFAKTPAEEGLLDLNGVEIDVTKCDAEDLNAGLSITALTTQGEEIELFPE